jgi:8-oxo-dGTP pyrophosphatase MutT (NUDIX family)
MSISWLGMRNLEVGSPMSDPRILERKEMRLSPWSSVTARTVVLPGRTAPEDYHSLRQSDYVTVLAVTQDGRIPLVRQYRPALESFSLELPGGLRDSDENPTTSALRELEEEAGFVAIADPYALGNLTPDSGRLENRFWAYFVTVSNDRKVGWQPEPGIESLLVDQAELREWILNGTFDNALHIALIGLAVLHNVFEWKSR